MYVYDMKTMTHDTSVPHFVLLPLMSSGHMIPMTDMAKLLAQHRVHVTIVTTPLNALRFSSTIQRSSRSNGGQHIQLLTLDFPSVEAGLPPGCESMESLSDRRLISNFHAATTMLRLPFEDLLRKLHPPATCLVSGKNLPWTAGTCREFRIPRIFFDGMGCFSSVCVRSLEASGVHERANSRSDPVLIPGLPHEVSVCRAKLPESLNQASTDLNELRRRMRADEDSAEAIVVNTFAELEAEYVDRYKRFKGEKVFCIGPVSRCNVSDLDRAERGGEGSYSKSCLEWLDAQETGSVVYACLGSISGLRAGQLKELGLGLEMAGKPFLWAIRGGERSEDLERWILEDGFEERTRGRGIVVRGWAPQLAILSHPAVGAFLSHCGWNSTLEGVSAGVPLVTCPLFAEQFLNEKLVVEILGVGASVGVEAAVTWGLEHESGVVMRREGVKAAVEKALERGEEGEERRNKARELADAARRALEEGGSSYRDIEMLIQYVRQQTEIVDNIKF